MFQCARVDCVECFRFGLARHLLPQEEIAIIGNQGFRQRIRLRQKRPMVDLQRSEAVHPLPVIIGRQDIEHGELR